MNKYKKDAVPLDIVSFLLGTEAVCQCSVDGRRLAYSECLLYFCSVCKISEIKNVCQHQDCGSRKKTFGPRVTENTLCAHVCLSLRLCRPIPFYLCFPYFVLKALLSYVFQMCLRFPNCLNNVYALQLQRPISFNLGFVKE